MAVVDTPPHWRLLPLYRYVDQYNVGGNETRIFVDYPINVF
jgi:hypothetical protein